MKKTLILTFLLIFCLSLFGCSNNEASKEVEALIIKKCDEFVENYDYEEPKGYFEEYSYIYDNKTCNGSFPLFYEYAGWDDELYIFMAQPELIGIKTKNLPKMIIDDPYTYTFEYEFDQDNYITSCTMNKEYYGEYGYSKEYYYEFVWE